MIDLQYDSLPALVTNVTAQKIFAMGPKEAIIGAKAVTVIPWAPCPIIRTCTCDRALDGIGGRGPRM
jgi:hypothetical protein